MTDTHPPNITYTTTVTGVTIGTYTGRPVEIISEVIPMNDPNPNEGSDDDDDDDASLMSLYSCNYCHSFGMEGCPCSRCGEDSSCYYVGDKMTQEKIEKYIEIMEEEDKENERSDSDSEDGEDDG
jgi:hypothetical protein